jgi:hypothetical protein
MDSDEIAVGMQVRYSGTGTTGTVVRLDQQNGTTFAELDSTHLMYSTKFLFPVEQKAEKKYQRVEDIKKTIEEERKFVSGSEYQESLKNLDQSCEGGG